MARASKEPVKVGEIFAENLSDKFARLADDNRFWMQKRDKSDKTAPFLKVGRNLDIEALNEQFDDKHFFNLWCNIEDIEINSEEWDKLLNKLAKEFYGTDYILGTKHPHESKDGKKVSLAILGRNT